MGAISLSDNDAQELVVFIAILLHKAPSAFGIVSYLLHGGAGKVEARRHLIAFSLAAPVSALVTRALLGGWNLFAKDASPVGLCILFSGGTFLYTIAMHVLPEVQAHATNMTSQTQATAATATSIHGLGGSIGSNKSFGSASAPSLLSSPTSHTMTPRRLRSGGALSASNGASGAGGGGDGSDTGETTAWEEGSDGGEDVSLMKVRQSLAQQDRIQDMVNFAALLAGCFMPILITPSHSH